MKSFVKKASRPVARLVCILQAPAFAGLVVSGLDPPKSLAQTASSGAVPFVGCAADGQTGPIAAPITVSATPTIAPAAAAQLAYYVSPHLGVLAPRGWHCFETYGSAGSDLLVTPERHDATDLLGSNANVTGPGIQLSWSSGETSGRFEVAKIAARLFPSAKAFVQRVVDEGLEPAVEFPFGAYPNDILTRRSTTEVEFLTPGNSEGMGTSFNGFMKNDQPVSGVAILQPNGMDIEKRDSGAVILRPANDALNVTKLDVRLPPELRGLTKTIIETVEEQTRAAEISSANVCRRPEMAGALITDYNDLPWEDSLRRVVDVEDLVTVRTDLDKGILVCHGIWVHTNGIRLEGTMTMRPNVAGDIIVNWEKDHLHPPVSVVAPAAPQASAPAPSNVSVAFQQGLTDREAWEDWLVATSGDYRTGATYWSAQRSLPRPGSCTALGGDATGGCLAARARLGTSDVRRKREPDYRQGWNSYPTQ